jgi:heparan-alpha-glucosaminide N-acetyltransferase
MKTPTERLASLDAFRGFDILVMIFVNYISGMPGIPFFLRHAETYMDTFTLTDVVFPGFLFIVGVAIPLSLEKRLALGEPLRKILGRIGLRTAGLLFLGVLFVNEHSYSEEATGISRDLWYFLALIATIFLWMTYPKTEKPSGRRLNLGLRTGAAILLLVLVIIWRGEGPPGSASWLHHSWWGILGMIGWIYLGGSLLYLLVKGDRAWLMGGIGFQVALYIGARHGALDFLGPVNEFVHVGSIFGSHLAIVTSGMVIGTLFIPAAAGLKPRSRIAWMAVFGSGLLAAGFLLRPLHGFSKNQGTESYCLATSGILGLLLLLFYWLMDVVKFRGWAAFLRPIGRNPLLAYIMPDIVGSLVAIVSGLFRLDVWKAIMPYWERGGLPGMLSAAAMTGIILFITWALTRKNVILKI